MQQKYQKVPCEICSRKYLKRISIHTFCSPKCRQKVFEKKLIEFEKKNEHEKHN
jgi:ribosomal protein L37AE/L43A